MMGHLRRFLWRLINAIRPGREEAALARELASHLVLLEDEYRRRGLSADEARRSALLALGGVDQAKERHRDARTFRWFDDTRRDAVTPSALCAALRFLPSQPRSSLGWGSGRMRRSSPL